MDTFEKFPFLDLEKLKSSYLVDRSMINGNFEKIIIIGIGGSSQGSKAINAFLNEERVVYFDHLNESRIKKTLGRSNLNKTGFIFISKSGSTSEVLTIFDYLVSNLESEINISNQFFSITEINSSPLHDLSLNKGIKIIDYKKEIGGRFSIFSNASLIPGFYFNKDLIDDFFDGAKKTLEVKNKIEDEALLDYKMLEQGKVINANLIYGDELYEIANWKKQLFAESLGKDGKGLLPIVSSMPKDQHSLLQLYLDGPKNIFFEILSLDYKSPNLLNITLNNHKDAMQEVLLKEIGNSKVNVFKQNNLNDLGAFFCYEIIKVIHLAQLMNVDPFTQDAVEMQKFFLN